MGNLVARQRTKRRSKGLAAADHRYVEGGSFVDDGLPIPEVGSWAVEKYTRVRMYCRLFSTGMKSRWDRRVCVNLFAGSGLVRVRDTGEILAGSPLIALNVPDPFDEYVFCEYDPDIAATLRARVHEMAPDAKVTYVEGDVDKKIGEVIEAIPESKSVLSFCFVDPYRLQPLFETIRELAEQRAPMDFLSVLTLGHDANRNQHLYLRPDNDTIEGFLGDADWRQDWEAKSRSETFMHFLARKYAEAMEGIGYLPSTPGLMYPVRSREKNLLLYYLAFFSRHSLGFTFWRQVLKYTTDQLSLDL